MTRKDRYSNFSHESPNQSSCFCRLCDAVVKKGISGTSCDKQITKVKWS
jgi:hypothetical protein